MTDESAFNGSNENQNENDASLWREDSARPAGFRQTLKIGDAEYGFCWIPPGEFDMGSPETEKGRFDFETLHHVKLTRGFWALETPTTQALYKEVMGTNPCKMIGDDLPVEYVSWNDANAFCETLTKRLPAGLKATLPTEAQWEYACRAGTKTAYWYGDVDDLDKMNYDLEIGRTTPVKSYPPNPWGLYDMHGNVWEWCLDWDDDDFSETSVDPVGTERPYDRMVREGDSPAFIVGSGFDRAMRGGAWDCLYLNCRSAYGGGEPCYFRGEANGFRFLLICD